MWADAQRDGRPAEFGWHPLRKFRNSIPCTMPQSLADPAAGVPCIGAANIGERNTSTHSEVCTCRNSVRGQEPPKMYVQCTSAGDGQTSYKVWLASGERRRCSNEATTRNTLKFAGVPQTRQQISAASGTKFAILCGHMEEILLFDKFFSDCRYMPQLRRLSPTNSYDGAQMAIFCVIFASCISSEPLAAHFRLAF